MRLHRVFWLTIEGAASRRCNRCALHPQLPSAGTDKNEKLQEKQSFTS
jgi:hypothetical protein